MSSVGDEYPKEQARCRELLETYRRLGPVGQFGATMIVAVIEQAERAAISGDPVEVIRAFKAMQGCS